MSGIRFSSDPSPTPALSDLDLTPTSLAEELGGAEKGWSRFRAYRKMLEIEAAFPGVVRRIKGRQLVATAQALAPHVEGLRETHADREIRLLRSRVTDLEGRMDAEVKANLQFRNLAHQWFANAGVRYTKANKW